MVSNGVKSEKISVIYTGIETSKFYPIARQDALVNLKLNDVKRILYIGNLIRSKGVNDLISAVVQLRRHRQDFEVCIAGKGPEKPFIEQFIEKNDHRSYIKILGMVDHQELKWWINASSCVCLPSYSEGVPNVVLEAMACKTNVVATKVGGIPEVIDNGLDYLVEPGDITSLTSALGKMLDETEFVTQPKFPIWTYQQMADVVKEKITALQVQN